MSAPITYAGHTWPSARDWCLWIMQHNAAPGPAQNGQTAALDAYRAEMLREAADAIDAKQAEYETQEREQFGSLAHETELQGQAVRDMAKMLRRKADEASDRPEPVPLVVSRFDVAMEPAPEEEPVLTVGAVAEDGRPVALLFDPETRAKVAGWLAPADTPAELERLRAENSWLRSAQPGNARLYDTAVALERERDALRTEVALLAHATAFEISRPGNLPPLLLQRSYMGGDRWMICDRTGRRWHRDEGWFYEAQNVREQDRTDCRFPLAEAWPLAHQIAAADVPSRDTDSTRDGQP